MLECSVSLASHSPLLHLHSPNPTSSSCTIASSSSSSRTTETATISRRSKNELWRQAPKRPSLRVVSMAAEDNRDLQAKEAAQAQADVSLKEIEAKLGLGRRGRRRQKEAQAAQNESSDDGIGKRSSKSWEAMTMPEKAWELYAGEKGFLFWLNKLAYASIFVLVGGWILFRFIGPALGLYQLDSPLLPPDQAFTRP